MPFAFSTSALFLPDLCSILRPKCEAQDRAMLHAAIINFRRRIVNRTRGFSCRAAAQFNPGLEVLRWGYGGATVGGWRGQSILNRREADRTERSPVPFHRKQRKTDAGRATSWYFSTYVRIRPPSEAF